MDRIMLVDTLGSMFYHFHAKDRHLVANFIANLQKIVSKYKVDAVYMLKEGGSKYRNNLLPSYKSARKLKREKYTEKEKADYQKFLKQVTEACDVLKLLGVGQVHHIGAEADDLAGYLCATLPEEYQVLMLSEDTDWHQLLSRPNTVQGSYKLMAKNIDDLSGKYWVSYTSYTKEHSITPDQLYESKVLSGDTSDSIPGIDGLGETGAKNLISRYGSLQEVLNNSHCIDVPRITAKAKEGLTNNREVLGLGHKLMNLRWSQHAWEEILELESSEPITNQLLLPMVDITAFTEKCFEQGWLAFTEEEWLDTFNKNAQA